MVISLGRGAFTTGKRVAAMPRSCDGVLPLPGARKGFHDATDYQGAGGLLELSVGAVAVCWPLHAGFACKLSRATWSRLPVSSPRMEPMEGRDESLLRHAHVLHAIRYLAILSLLLHAQQLRRTGSFLFRPAALLSIDTSSSLPVGAKAAPQRAPRSILVLSEPVSPPGRFVLPDRVRGRCVLTLTLQKWLKSIR